MSKSLIYSHNFNKGVKRKRRNIITLKDLQRLVSHLDNISSNPTKEVTATANDSPKIVTTSDSKHSSISYTPTVYNNDDKVNFSITNANYIVSDSNIIIKLLLTTNNSYNWEVTRSLYFNLPKVDKLQFSYLKTGCKDRYTTLIPHLKIPRGITKTTYETKYDFA